MDYIVHPQILFSLRFITVGKKDNWRFDLVLFPPEIKSKESEKGLAMGMKEAYQDKAEAQLHEWQEWIEQYAADPTLSRSIKLSDRQRMVERLEDCHRIARVRLEELRSSKDERWELAKQAVERAMIDLKRVIDESGAGHAARLLQLQASRSYVYEPFQKRG